MSVPDILSLLDLASYILIPNCFYFMGPHSLDLEFWNLILSPFGGHPDHNHCGILEYNFGGHMSLMNTSLIN